MKINIHTNIYTLGHPHNQNLIPFVICLNKFDILSVINSVSSSKIVITIS